MGGDVKMIPEWRRAWRMFSVQAMVASSAIQGTWLALPPDMRSTIDGGVVSALTIAMLVLGIVGRLVYQGIEDE